jgi:hypothetical protein
MHVYLIKAVGKWPMYKIGKAKNPASRLASLQTGSPMELELVGFVRCKGEAHAGAVEQSFHHRFRRSRHRGEWFKLWPKDEKWLVEMMQDGMAKWNEELLGLELNKAMDAECARRL